MPARSLGQSVTPTSAAGLLSKAGCATSVLRVRVAQGSVAEAFDEQELAFGCADAVLAGGGARGSAGGAAVAHARHRRPCGGGE